MAPAWVAEAKRDRDAGIRLAILKEKGEKVKLDLRNILSLIVYISAAVFGGFLPVAAFSIVALVSLWWVFPKKKKKAQ